MTIYIAAPFGRHKDAEALKTRIERETGHKVISTWSAKPQVMSIDLPRLAAQDSNEINRCSVFVRLADTDEAESAGGKFVEMGLALAWCRDIVLIGPRECIFDHLPEVSVFQDEEEFLEWLKK